MVVGHDEQGFTVVEMVVTLVVMSLFLTLFFQTSFSSQTQQVNVARLAAANSISQANLNKISAKSLIPSGTTACNTSGSSENNPLTNVNAKGSLIASDDTNHDPAFRWDSPTVNMSPESLANTPLPSATTQVLRVLYPQGCLATAPAQIISTVTYGSETVTHAAYIN